MIRFTFSKLSKACAAGLLSVASLAALPASAQNVPVNYPGGNTPRTNNGGSYNAGSLTTQSLPGFLTSLGLHPEASRNSKNEIVSYTLPFDTGKSSGKISVGLSPDQTKLWLVVGLGPIGRGTQSLEVMRRLIEYNESLGDIRFGMYENGFLVIKKVIDNLNVTSERFQFEAGRLLDAVESTHSFWGPLLTAAAAETQGQPSGNPAPAPAPSPNGGDVGNDNRLFPGRH